MDEAKLQRQIRKRLEEEIGGLWIKIHGGPYSSEGVSDIIGCLAGKFIAFEVKLPGKEKTLTRLQQKFIDKVKAQGGIAGMVTSFEDCCKLLAEGFPCNIEVRVEDESK